MLAHDPPSMDPRRNYLRYFVPYKYMYVPFICFSKADKQLSAMVLFVHFKADTPSTDIFSRVPAPFN